MLQTDRKTEQTRQTAKEEKSVRQKQSSEVQSAAALALQAILSGGDWEQLPADGVLSLSHTMGNAALAELAALRDTGPETAGAGLPRTACGTAPMQWDTGAPLLAEPPAFGAMSPMGDAAPIAI